MVATLATESWPQLHNKITSILSMWMWGDTEDGAPIAGWQANCDFN